MRRGIPEITKPLCVGQYVLRQGCIILKVHSHAPSFPFQPGGVGWGGGSAGWWNTEFYPAGPGHPSSDHPARCKVQDASYKVWYAMCELQDAEKTRNAREAREKG